VLDELRARAEHVVALLAPRIRDRDEDLLEARQPVPRLGRVVGAAEERLTVRRQEDGHRPATVAGERDDRVHVDRVEVGPLLAVHLDADEVLVHHTRGQRVLERLALHHMAPVARCVADREQDGLVLVARLLERRLVPRLPVDGVVRVLQQVGRRLLCEAIHPR
jgi:hypothetical protein